MPPRSAASSPRVTVLIVDHYLTMRQLLDIWLTEAGCRVLSAASSREAEQVLEREARIDIVITDVAMDQGRDIPVIAAAQRRHPRVRILAVSGAGSAADESLARATRHGADGVLAKPFTRLQLLTALEMIWPVIIDEAGSGRSPATS